MIFYKQERGETLIYDNDRVLHKYDRLGNLVSETKPNMSTSDLFTFKRASAISVLQSAGKKIFVGIQSGNEFVDFEVRMPYIQILTLLQEVGLFIVLLRNKGTLQGINYVQAIFLYTDNINLYNILNRAGVPIAQ